MEQYQVDYLINVQADAATASLTKFSQAMARVKGLDTRLTNLAKSAETLTAALNQLPKNGYRIKITIPERTTQAMNTLRTQLQNLKKMATAPMTVKINTTAALRSLQVLETRVTRLSAKMKTIGIGSIGAVAPTAGAPIGAGGSLAYVPSTATRMTPTQIRQAYGRQIGPMRGQTANIAGRNVPVWGAGAAGMVGTRGYLSYAPQNNSRISTQQAQQRKQSQPTVPPAGGGGKTPPPVPTAKYVAPRLRGGRATRSVAVAPMFGRANNRYSANALGHAEIVNPMALNMLKGMGIAYGLSGIMSLTGGVIRSATEYNNMMQTAKNILQSNDRRPNFANRVKGMEKVVRQIGIETKFTAPETADAARYLAMAGLNLETIKTSMPSIADLALIGDSDLGTTADVVTNIMTAYGIHPNKMRNAADIMTRTFTMSNTTLMEIAESYKYSASLLAAAGIPFAESAGAIGVLGDAGIKASQAGTSLRTILNNIVKPTKSQREMWKKLGIKRFVDEDANGDSVTGQMRSLLEIFTDLNRKNVSVDTYYKLFRLTAAQGAAALAMHVDKWQNITERNGESEGLSQRLAEAKKNTVQGLWAQMTSSFTEQGIRAFESKQGQITEVLKKFTTTLQSDSTQNAIQGLTDRLWSLGEAIVSFSKIVGKAFSVMAGPIDGFIRVELWAGALAILARSLKSIVNVGGMGLNWMRQMGSGSIARTAWMHNTVAAWKQGNTGFQTAARGMLRGRGNAESIFRNLQAPKRYGFSPTQIQALQNGNYVYNPSQRRAGGGQFGGAWKPNSRNIYLQNKATYDANTAAHIARWEKLYNQKYNSAAIFRSGIGATLAGGALGALGGVVGSQMFDSPVGSLIGATTLGLGGYMLPSLLAGTGMGAMAMTGIGAGAAILLSVGLALQNINRKAHEAATSMVNFANSVNMVNGVNIADTGDYIAQHMSVIASSTMTANEQLEKHIALLQQEMGITSPATSGNEANNQQTYSQTSAARSTQLWQAYRGLSAKKMLADLMSDTRFKEYDDINAALHMLFPNIPNPGIRQGHTPTAAQTRALVLLEAGLAEADETARQLVEGFKYRMSTASPTQAPEIYAEYLQAKEKWNTPGGVTGFSRQQIKEGSFSWYDYQPYREHVASQLNAADSSLKAFTDFYSSPGWQTASQLLYNSFGAFAMSPDIIKSLGLFTPEWYGYINSGLKEKFGEAAVGDAWEQLYNNIIENVTNNWSGSTKGQQQILRFLREGFSLTVKSAARPSEGMTVEDGKYVYRSLQDDWYDPITKESIPYVNGPYKPSDAASAGDMASEYSSVYESASASPKQVVVNIESLMNVDAVNMGDPDVQNTLANLRESMATVLMGVVSDFTQEYQNA